MAPRSIHLKDGKIISDTADISDTEARAANTEAYITDTTDGADIARKDANGTAADENQMQEVE